MPELPEVECTVRYLEKKLTGQKIQDVIVNWKKSIVRPDHRSFVKSLKGAGFVDFSRRGKYIVMQVRNSNLPGSFLIAHLRMSGSFDVVTSAAMRSKHDQVIFKLKNNKELRFHDIRKFGKIYLVRDKNEILSKLGLEPFSPDCTPEAVFKIFQKFKSPVKTVLLRQDILAGVGNIYADESLWAAKIHPLRPANKLSLSEISRLLSNLKKIFKKAIKHNGTDNGDGVVDGGMYSPKVYGQAGKKCIRCKTTLKRTIVAQRGTTSCPTCQS